MMRLMNWSTESSRWGVTSTLTFDGGAETLHPLHQAISFFGTDTNLEANWDGETLTIRKASP